MIEFSYDMNVVVADKNEKSSTIDRNASAISAQYQ